MEDLVSHFALMSINMIIWSLKNIWTLKCLICILWTGAKIYQKSLYDSFRNYPQWKHQAEGVEEFSLHNCNRQNGEQKKDLLHLLNSQIFERKKKEVRYYEY